MSNLRAVTFGLHRSLQRNSIQKVQFAYFHPLKRSSTNPKTHKMEAMLSLLGIVLCKIGNMLQKVVL